MDCLYRFSDPGAVVIAPFRMIQNTCPLHRELGMRKTMHGDFSASQLVASSSPWSRWLGAFTQQTHPRQRRPHRHGPSARTEPGHSIATPNLTLKRHRLRYSPLRPFGEAPRELVCQRDHRGRDCCRRAPLAYTVSPSPPQTRTTTTRAAHRWPVTDSLRVKLTAFLSSGLPNVGSYARDSALSVTTAFTRSFLCLQLAPLEPKKKTLARSAPRLGSSWFPRICLFRSQTLVSCTKDMEDSAGRFSGGVPG